MSSYAPCAACKYLRRKCTQECVFAPYFPPDNPQKFISVHKIFGASNVGKILNELDPINRNEAVNSLAYEADCRIKDPIYGCVGLVSILQHRLRNVHEEIERAKQELATYIGPTAMQPTQPVMHEHEPSQQSMVSRDQEMLRVYVQQQQEQFYLQQQELYAHQQQSVYLNQQQFDNGGDFGQVPEGVQPALGLGGGEFSKNHYQTQMQEQGRSPIQELVLMGQQQQQVQYQEFAVAQPQGSQGQRDVIQEERSFGPL